jgi:hypothetical protein
MAARCVTSRVSSLAVLSVPLLLLACADVLDDAATVEPGRARLEGAPLVGKADGADVADHECRVVLRQVAPRREGPGFEERCVEGFCWVVFRGQVDVAREALYEGAELRVLYRRDDGAWASVGGASTGDSPAGFVRYGFALDDHTLRLAGTSTTGLARAEVALIPYLATPDGGRAFDHNRVVDPLGSYVLRAETGWSVADDAAVCGGGTPTTLWIGNLALQLSRAASAACTDASPWPGQVVFDDWARTRATQTHVCFEVWSPGVTDWDDPDLWRKLDVRVSYRYGGVEEGWRYVDLAGRVGNNARYAVDLRPLDPFPRNGPTRCPEVPYEVVPSADGGRLAVDFEFYVTVSGQRLAPEGGWYSGRYEHYAVDGCVP